MEFRKLFTVETDETWIPGYGWYSTGRMKVILNERNPNAVTLQEAVRKAWLERPEWLEREQILMECVPKVPAEQLWKAIRWGFEINPDQAEVRSGYTRFGSGGGYAYYTVYPEVDLPILNQEDIGNNFFAESRIILGPPSSKPCLVTTISGDGINGGRVFFKAAYLWK